jgi:hypothetical protein
MPCLKAPPSQEGNHARVSAMIALLIASALLHGTPSPVQTPRPSSTPDPCAGPAALLAALNRPTVGFSPCAVAAGKVLLEEGYQLQRGPGTERTAQYPQGFERVGIGSGWEIDALGPAFNVVADHGMTAAGLSDAGIGFKFRIPIRPALTLAVDGLYTTPNGSREFTAGASTETINADASYPLSPSVGIGTTLAFSSTAGTVGGIRKRYTVFEPSVVLTKQIGTPLQVYAEYVAAGNPDAGIGGRAFVDYGFQRLFGQNFEIDVEEGSTFSRDPAKRFNYFGAGFGLLLP